MSELTAIYYIWRRELIRFYRSKSRIIGSLGMPFFFLAIIGTGMGSVVQVANGSYLDFMTPGILSMVVLFGSIFSGVTVIMDRQFGFLKETMVAPVNRTSIVIGKALGGATTAVIQGMLMLGIAMLLGAHIEIVDLLPAMALMFIVSVMFVSLGIAIASTMEDMHGFQLVMNFLVMPMFFLSGALFPLNMAPELIRWLSYIDPMTYVVEASRYLLVGYSTMPIEMSGGVIGIFLIVSVTLATWLFNRIES
ncbi:ABC transporter permease [Candidatus Micrarchaeota archaeon]|nr:ABC transporter permease [Candidatus Micrarchaeota archaeon]